MTTIRTAKLGQYLKNWPNLQLEEKRAVARIVPALARSAQLQEMARRLKNRAAQPSQRGGRSVSDEIHSRGSRISSKNSPDVGRRQCR